MKDLNYHLGDIVEMRKPHPCSSRSNQFEIVREGADMKIKCLGCGAILMFTRDDFNQKFKRVVRAK